MIKTHDTDVIPPEVIDAFKVLSVIVGGLILISLVMASLLFGPQQLAIGAFVLFALILFVGAPMWIATMQEVTHHE
ncbi:MAG: hypothetical protein ACYTGC_02615 [Planctomycetota bacterium]|jgi:hypothetical protein